MTRLPCRLDWDLKLTLSDIANKYQRLINLQRDTNMVQCGDYDRSEVHIVQQPSNTAKPEPVIPSSSYPSSVH